jgi:hypothetical protein
MRSGEGPFKLNWNTIRQTGAERSCLFTCHAVPDIALSFRLLKLNVGLLLDYPY